MRRIEPAAGRGVTASAVLDEDGLAAPRSRSVAGRGHGGSDADEQGYASSDE
jgi:hypothetical protein